MSANEDEARPSSASEDAAEGAPPRWFDELRQAASALRELAAAQWQLLGAELRLARAAALTSLLAALVATALTVSLGLTLLALLGWALAHWFGSWLWALVALAVLQALGLAGAVMLFRSCLRWLTLPNTRAQWHSLVRRPARQASAPARQSPLQDGGARAHVDTSKSG